MTNLLAETILAIKDSGHKVSDIIFIGNEEGYCCEWSEYKKLANISYDSGFGSASVATDLKIVFKDGATMYRGEYDGSEWWEYSRPFNIPEKSKPIKRLVGDYWPSLENLQDDDDDHHNPELRGKIQQESKRWPKDKE